MSLSEREEALQKAIRENEYAQKLLDTSLREVYKRIKKMIGKSIWDQKFVAKCLHGFEQCLKVLDADYDTIDLLTSYYYCQLPEVVES